LAGITIIPVIISISVLQIGFKKRLERHLSRQKNQFWHIDYLLNNQVSSEVINIWTSHAACECSISRQLFKDEIGIVVTKGFGSSDCKCITHLF